MLIVHLQPRKGCFEVRTSDGTSTYVSLLVSATPLQPHLVPARSPHGCIIELVSLHPGSEHLCNMQDMPRPFTKLKALDLDELAAQIVDGNKS